MVTLDLVLFDPEFCQLWLASNSHLGVWLQTPAVFFLSHHHSLVCLCYLLLGVSGQVDPELEAGDALPPLTQYAHSCTGRFLHSNACPCTPALERTGGISLEILHFPLLS